jgi:cation diffusion facilitator family transporter
MSTSSANSYPLQHDHDHHDNEQRTWYVFILTAVMMIVEISAGFLTGSMALLADGWHMGTHTAAFGITIFAYRYARNHKHDKSFSFGPGKVTTLGGFASAVALAVVALMMIIESTERFFNPRTIMFNEAIIVAIIGLAVNLISAIVLMGTSIESHTHSHNHHDHNLRSAYFHVLADALTSIFAIIALFTGKYLGWNALDPLMGIVGAIVIIKWSHTLLGSSAAVLLDRAAGISSEKKIRDLVEADGHAKVTDLKLWFLAPNKHATSIVINCSLNHTSNYYRGLLTDIDELSYIAVEITSNSESKSP